MVNCKNDHKFSSLPTWVFAVSLCSSSNQSMKSASLPLDSGLPLWLALLPMTLKHMSWKALGSWDMLTFCSWKPTTTPGLPRGWWQSCHLINAASSQPEHWCQHRNHSDEPRLKRWLTDSWDSKRTVRFGWCNRAKTHWDTARKESISGVKPMSEEGTGSSGEDGKLSSPKGNSLCQLLLKIAMQECVPGVAR